VICGTKTGYTILHIVWPKMKPAQERTLSTVGKHWRERWKASEITRRLAVSMDVEANGELSNVHRCSAKSAITIYRSTSLNVRRAVCWHATDASAIGCIEPGESGEREERAPVRDG